MQFRTEQEAYDFYNAYAGVKGFSIRRSSSHSVKNSTTIKNRTFCCSRAGITLNSSCIIFLIVKVRTSRPISKGIILTMDNLAKRNWTGSKQCCFCHKDETIRHLVYDCHFYQAAWAIINVSTGI
jgi:hypothetical protein